jgi:hypothetical protein
MSKHTPLPDFEDHEWDRLRVFHQMRVAAAVQGLREHAGFPGNIELPLSDFTVIITTNNKQGKQ